MRFSWISQSHSETLALKSLGWSQWGPFFRGLVCHLYPLIGSSPFSLPVPGALQGVLGPAKAAMPELLRGKGCSCGHRPSCGPRSPGYPGRASCPSGAGRLSLLLGCVCVCVCKFIVNKIVETSKNPGGTISQEPRLPMQKI